ncbi:MAG: hypothetical protein EA377_12700 [Phycisphaerales bacterium]|nr:MAG: hypothetical protein EA377_12700 [Phycisphaerales bacterium]
MFSRFLRLVRRTSGNQGATSNAPTADLPWLSRESIAHLLVTEEDLPHVDWGMAEAWIEHQSAPEQAEMSAADLHRAIAAAWLDELRDALATDSRRWRTAQVEGLAPLEGNIGPRAAAAADRSLRVIGEALREIRGEPRNNPIPPIGIVALGTHEEYYSFIARFYADEDEYATSGGLYIRSTAEEFPVLAIAAQATFAIEETMAHELTHHAFAPDRPELGHLPMWVEEGLAQMMEEYVTRAPRFVFDREILERHQALWLEIGLDGFASGESFHSPEGEEQELSYNLAEALTRSLATTRRADFFAFVRACRNERQDHELAAREHLGGTVEELAESMISSKTH